MSELTKLLEGVKMGWQSLATVANIYDGTHQTPKYVEMGVPFVSVQNIKNLYATNKYISLQDFEKYKYKPQRGDIFMTRIGSIGSCAIVENDNPLAYYVTLTLIRVNHDVINSKYLKHIIESTIGQGELLKRTLVNATPIKINLGEIGKIQIPIPCPDNPEKSLKIQEEIVRILDRLSEETNQLNAALQKELVLHQKQYNCYREELFNPKDKEVVWKSLKDLGSFTYGYAASALDSGDTRFVRITDINANGKLIESDPKYVNLAEDNKKYLLKKDDLLMARTGATFGKTMIFTESYAAIYAGFLIRLNLEKTIILPKFYWHFAQSILFWHQANNLVSGGGQPQFNANALKRVMVPIPYERDVVKSLAEQDRVVKILDEMDEKNQAITSAIKKEVALRNKQYEYYRDRLLSFQSLETEAEAIQ